MAKTRSAHSYELELKRMIKSRTGADCEPWLLPQVRATAANMVMLDKMQDELTGLRSLVTLVAGSTGQTKSEVNPLVPLYDKMQRTLTLQFEVLGLNYKTTPSKMKEDVRKGIDENDTLLNAIQSTKDNLNDMGNFE